LNFTLTNAGTAAINYALASATTINLATFSVGSAYNYSPTVLDTALHGNELYSGPLLTYAVIDPNTVQYTLYMDTTIGNFSYGEVGIFLSTVSSFTGSISTTNLTVSSITSGTIVIGQTLSGTSIAAGTVIVSQTSGTAGGVGVYVVNNTQTLASTSLIGKTLFALASLPNYQSKTSGVSGNIISIAVNLTIANAQAIINFPVTQVALAQSLIVAKLSLLPPPVLAQTNAYQIGQTDDGGLNIIYCIRDNDYLWGFPSHQVVSVSGACETGTTTNTIVSSSIGTLLVSSGVVNGKYILQMTSGILKGYSRVIQSSSNNSITWLDPFNTSPNSGDTYQILQSNFSVFSTIANIVDDAFINTLIFGSD